MTDYEIEQLVSHVGDGNASIHSIREKFPNLSDASLRTIVFGDTVHIPLLHMDNALSLVEQRTYRFQDSDTVSLSLEGQNILYRVRRQERMEAKQDEAIKWARRAYYGMLIIGFFSTMIGLVSLALQFASR